MRINKKIINWIAIAIAIVCLGLFITNIFLLIIDSYFFGFKQNNSLKYRHLILFNENYQKRISADTSWNARKSGYINFYKYDSDEICILELSQYSIIEIKDIKINNYLTIIENTDFSKYDINISSNEYPYSNILFYPMRQKVTSLSIYIKSNIEKIIKKENSLYLKFKSTPFELNSIEKYAELAFKCISKPPIELLILKKQDRTLFIFKYSTEREIKDKTSLLDMIDMK